MTKLGPAKSDCCAALSNHAIWNMTESQEAYWEKENFSEGVHHKSSDVVQLEDANSLKALLQYASLP